MRTLHFQPPGSEAGAIAFAMHPDGSLSEALSRAARTAESSAWIKRGRAAVISTPAQDVLNSLPTLLAARRRCLDRPTFAPPRQWDGLPTVGGARWLHPAAPVLNTPRCPGFGGTWAHVTQCLSRHATSDAVPYNSTDRPRCVFCNQSAGCCADGWRVDARELYRCTLCY